MQRTVLLLALAALAMPVSAATSWSAASACSNTMGNANGNYCVLPGGSTGTTAVVSAWATTNQSGGSELWQDAQLMKYSGGFGVTNRDGADLVCDSQGKNCVSRDPGETTGSAPEHAVDNNGKVDGVLYTFTSNIALQTLRLGWKDGTNGDTDLAVFRFAGTGVPPQLSTTSAGGLTSAGWEHVGNYANVGTSANLCLAGVKSGGGCNTNDSSSSWWLVTAYNPSYVNPKFTKSGAIGGGNDYFKLLTVSGDITDVSEPAALALAGLGLMGVLFTRRRKHSAVTTA